MKKIVLVFLVLVVSCATTTPGKKVSSSSKLVDAYIKINSDYSKGKIKSYLLSLSNNSDEWIEIIGAKIVGADSAQVLVGDKLNTWIEVREHENAVSKYNRDLFWGTVAVAGAAVAASGKSSGSTNTGLAILGGAIAVSTANSLIESKKGIEFNDALPVNHLLRKFIIPPRSSVQKWIILENVSKDQPGFDLIQSDDSIIKISSSETNSL